jgi:acyl-coenzyme A synthetase/AMP-(fatty) acid ligase
VDGSSGATLLSATDLGQALGRTRGAEGIGDSSRSGVAVRMLTSGTTGPPKRIDLSYATLERVLSGAKHYEANRSSDLRLRTGSIRHLSTSGACSASSSASTTAGPFPCWSDSPLRAGSMP